MTRSLFTLTSLFLCFVCAPTQADDDCNCATDEIYAIRLVALDNPSTQAIVESHPLMKGVNVVTVFVRTASDIQRTATAYANSSKLETVSRDIGDWTTITFHESIDNRVDYAKLLSISPKTLVDSRCSYGKRSGFKCKGKTKYEYCVDSGASANRCSDRNDFGCSRLWYSWVPPSRCRESDSPEDDGVNNG